MHPESISKTKFRVGIDAHALGSSLGGNETYLRCLLRGLRHHPEYQYLLYVSHPGAREIAAEHLPEAECHIVSQNPLKRLGIDLPLASQFHRLDLLHLQYVAPLSTRCLVSLMIHDLSYEHHPAWFRRSEVLRFRATIPRSAAVANVVMTVSHFCREDIIGRLHLPPEKVVVTPNAVSPIYQPIDREGQESVKNRWSLPERYILALGNLQPRKNIETLLRAWKAIMHKPSMENVSLVLTGKRAWLHDDILQEANQEGMERVLFTGYLPEKDLPALYSGAMMFVYPSLFEGFGLPPIEAMACGTPVIVGRNSALGETCGDAARYADVLSEGSLADAMVSLASDHLERERLAALGIARAAHFTLENLAEPTLRSWKNILPQGIPPQR